MHPRRMPCCEDGSCTMACPAYQVSPEDAAYAEALREGPRVGKEGKLLDGLGKDVQLALNTAARVGSPGVKVFSFVKLTGQKLRNRDQMASPANSGSAVFWISGSAPSPAISSGR